ncbi:MAG: PorP/SprF family type IX secretion system membrane protein, partial [Bacteroidota bacterium]
GTTQLKNTQLHLAGAYSKSLNRSGNHFVSFGGQIGYAWRRLSIDRLLFDNQFDGQKLNPALSSGEDFQEMERGYIDLTAGIGWSFAPDRYTNYYAGFALAHLNRPAVGFLDEEESLYRKKTFYAGGEFRLTYSLSIMPQAVYMVQGPSRAVNVGALLKVNMASANSDDPTTIYIGTMTRFKDAQVLLIRFDYGALGLSYSYDLNISGLRRASNGQGASELALMYRASLMNRSRNSRPVKCPSF